MKVWWQVTEHHVVEQVWELIKTSRVFTEDWCDEQC